MTGRSKLLYSVSWLGGLAGSVGLAAFSPPPIARAADPKAAPPAASAPAAAPAQPPAASASPSDSDWKKNSGSGAIPERYQIVKGDTLWGLSKRFFGDGMGWPKLYEQNKDTVSNPNLIYTGKWLVFTPGTGTSLPKLADQDSQSSGEPTAPDAPAASAKPAKKAIPGSDKINSAAAKERSQEWKELPRQSWEVSPVMSPSGVDRYGIDTTTRITFTKPAGFDLAEIAASERITTLGQIVGARSASEYVTLGDTVYIRADEDIQLGETYAITQEPSILKSRKSDRVGYSYLILGKVKIIGVRDDLFVGSIVSGRDFIARGNDIITAPARVPDLTPIAAPSPTEGVVMLDRNLSTFYTAQHKLIFVDRGSSDGVKEGMVFRAYEHYDLSNDKKITNSDFIIDADAMVVQVSDRFCVAMVINSLVPVTENSTAVLLTDISDLVRNNGLRSFGGDKKGPDELDELDKLDNSGGLGKDEQKELQQLEKWKGNPEGAPGQPPAPGGAPPPPPADTTPPPPPPPPAESKEELPPPPPAPETPPPPPAADTKSMDAPPPPPPPPVSEAPAADSKPAAKGNSEPPPPPPPPPAPGGGGGNAPSDESKALDQLLNN